MLRARLTTAAVVLPLLFLLVLGVPAWLFALFLCCVGIAGVAEYMAMAFAGRRREQATGIFLGTVLIAAALAGPGPVFRGGLAAIFLVGLVSSFVGREGIEENLEDFGILLTGVLYVGFLLPHFAWLREGFPHGAEVVFFLLVTMMLGDTGGYFVGRRFGRRKLIPHVSPGKTVEGAEGIVACSVIGAVLAKGCLLPILSHATGLKMFLPLGWMETVLLGAVTGVVGQFGDLSESLFKRSFGCKESGWLFPGHGGVLDRIDSLLFSVVVVYYYLLLSRS